MIELVRAIEGYAPWLYALLGLLLLMQLATMWRAGREREVALFELERQAATGKAIRAFVTVMLLVTIGAGTYTVAKVVAPNLPEDPRAVDDPAPIVTTPQLSDMPTPLDTPTPTGAPTMRPLIVTPTPTIVRSADDGGA